MADAQVVKRPAPGTTEAAILARDLAVEAIGTFALIFIGAGSIIATGGKDLVAIAFAHGLAIALMVAATGHFSGGAFNPAVALALALARKLSLFKTIGYVAAQLVGAVIAAMLLKAVFPSSLTDQVGLGTPAVGGPFSAGQAFLAEIITTFFLAYVIFGVAIDKRGATTIAALAIGLCITMDILATGAVSGAAMNPARWFGPALVQNAFANPWVWILGPAIGAAIAAVVYFYGYMQGREPEERQRSS
ncbi:MAG: aquaporin [Chloroflexi bacterium]|nr:MAG: aquaporin [Chloroflexota bacterium]